MIKAQNVYKSFNGGRIKVLNGVSLEIARGDFAVILGASGSGKSTLMSVLSGLERADSGTVCFDGMEISGLNDRRLTEFRRKYTGFIFQQYYLLSHLSVENNVRLGADLAGNKDFREIIKAVGLEEKCKRKPSELSGGEQQRVCIARALAKKPQALFLDEPTGALDEQTGRDVLDYIVKLKREQGFTMIMVTHNENIAQMADTVIRINSGRIEEVIKNTSPKTAYEIGW
jgi:putative ABC transport system ATP-binding protein